MKKIGRLHVLTDATLQNRFTHLELTEMAIDGGAHTIQFRQKEGSTKEMITTATAMKRLCASKGATFIVNDRIDVAIAAEADGVHLGQDDFPIPLARKLLGNNRIIGGSAATPEEIETCIREGVDYVGYGPVYATGSKDDAGPVSGIDLLGRIVSSTPVPVIAIGGIDQNNASHVLGTGAHGIAVISSVCCREDPQKAAKELFHMVAPENSDRRRS